MKTQTFPIRGPKWPGKHSPGFTRVIPPPELALKGLLGTARIGSEPLTGSRAHF